MTASLSAVVRVGSCLSMPTRTRQVSIWIWPVVAIVLVAVAGQIFGLLGAIIAASSAGAALLFTAAELLRSRRARQGAAVAAVATTVAVMAIFALQGAVPWSRASTGTGGALDMRVTASRLMISPLPTSAVRGSQALI